MHIDFARFKKLKILQLSLLSISRIRVINFTLMLHRLCRLANEHNGSFEKDAISRKNNKNEKAHLSPVNLLKFSM